MEIRVYDDLIKYHAEIVAWSNETSFEINKLSLHERKLLENINIIEIMFPGNQGKREDQRVYELYELFVRNFLSIVGINSYLVEVEFEAQKKNRIRSYKGIITRSIIKHDFLEQEIDIGNEETVIIGMVKIKEDNYEHLFDDFYGPNCFILMSSEDIFTNNYLISLVKNHIILDKRIIVNYSSLLLNEIKNNNIILRTAGDGGDVEVDLQIFAKKNLTESLISNIKCALQCS
jgi:hypothetical protein